MIRWFATNGIAANFLMLGILGAGAYTAMTIPLEVTPSLSWDTVIIEIPYRGATAKDVEKSDSHTRRSVAGKRERNRTAQC